jgi:hypothetical protein
MIKSSLNTQGNDYLIMVSCICAVENKKNKQMKKNLLLFALTLGVFSMALHAQNGPKISVQGKLNDVNGLPLADGGQELIFRLYHQPTSGTAFWADTVVVEITGGIYSYNLGSGNPLDPAQFDATVYVAVVVDGVEIDPRTELTHAPYTLRTDFAVQADTAHYALAVPTDSLEVMKNLRIIRGRITPTGVVSDGFTATPLDPNPLGSYPAYRITYNEPFPSTPTVAFDAFNTSGGSYKMPSYLNVSATSADIFLFENFPSIEFQIIIVGRK